MEHNRAAVRFILDELAPLRPDVAFVVHGSCGRQFTGIGLAPNVFVDTDPFRFDDYAVTGFVGINPVTTGGDTNLKVQHSLSRGLPVVSTPFGMRGHEDFRRAVTVCELADFSDALKNPVARLMPAQLKELMRHESIETTLRFSVGTDAQTKADAAWAAYERATSPAFLGGLPNSSSHSGRSEPSSASGSTARKSKRQQAVTKNGAAGTRTQDQRIKSPML